MPAQTRVPGAASSEVDFELQRFEHTDTGRIEIAGRWFGLRGRRFVRPVLNLTTTAGGRRRAIALLEHKPWAAADGETWIAAFSWPDDAGDVERAELEVGPGLMVELPAPGSVPDGAGRVSALRPPGATAAPALPVAVEPAAAPSAAVLSPPSATPRRDAINAAQAERDEAIVARDEAERERVTALNERDDALSRRDAALRDVDRAVSEREEAEAERDRLRSELDRITRERDHAYAERNRMMQDAEAVARERDQAAAERDAARAELSRVLPAREEAIRERDAEAARADQAESDRDTALAERKSAVAQRDRARRERDRAMRAVGMELPAEPGDGRLEALSAAVDGEDPEDTEVAAVPRRAVPAAGGVALPSRPLKRIGGAASGPAPEPKSLLTPVDASRPRRLSRSRPAPSGAARWAVRITVMSLLLVLALVVALGAISLL